MRPALLAGTGMVAFNLAVLSAERTAEPAVPGVLVGCAPVVVAVLVPAVEGRRPAPRVTAAAALVAAGAFGVQGWGATDVAGLLWPPAALGGEVAFAVPAVPVLRPLRPKVLSACVCGVAAAEAAPLGVALDGAEALRTAVIGFVCWYAGVQRIGAERATLFSGLIPVSAAPTAPLAGVGTYGTGQPAGTCWWRRGRRSARACATSHPAIRNGRELPPRAGSSTGTGRARSAGPASGPDRGPPSRSGSSSWGRGRPPRPPRPTGPYLTPSSCSSGSIAK